LNSLLSTSFSEAAFIEQSIGYWVSLWEFPLIPALLRAVIAAEDARFLDHHGIDLEALDEARAYNLRQRGRRRHGGSTITMQCARNVFLWPGRTYVRKAFEMYFAALLELLWGKRRILEVYVNVIEWGDGIYGAEAAARTYFSVSAAELSREQAAALAAVIINPRRYSPASPSRRIRNRIDLILERMQRYQYYKD
jgi:monofunctional biosynthetic peptidoglycan transglycosylase